jgi:hypothetical protein
VPVPPPQRVCYSYLPGPAEQIRHSSISSPALVHPLMFYIRTFCSLHTTNLQLWRTEASGRTLPGLV